MRVKLEMYLEINDDDLKEIMKLEHHIDYLLNLDEYPEIEYVDGVSVTVEKNKRIISRGGLPWKMQDILTGIMCNFL